MPAHAAILLVLFAADRDSLLNGIAHAGHRPLSVVGTLEKGIMQSRIIRVLPSGQGWALEFGGLNMKAKIFPTMEAAIAEGWLMARRESAELHIHRHDGNLRLRTPCGDKQEGSERPNWPPV